MKNEIIKEISVLLDDLTNKYPTSSILEIIYMARQLKHPTLSKNNYVKSNLRIKECLEWLNEKVD